MNPERQHFLNLHSKPGRFTSEEAAWFLGFTPHELPMIMGAGLLKPLGRPSDNGCKYFSFVELDKLKNDPAWLAKACDAILKYWKDRNLQRLTENAKARWPQKRLGACRVAPGKKPPIRLTSPTKK
jgi:hypothetical protein